MAEDRTIPQLRRAALGHDALLFSTAFFAGALVYVLGRALGELFGDTGVTDFWSISLSDDLILAGLLVGELFVIWNNGFRQGTRGHSIGKHRMGLAVVDLTDAEPIGAARGLLRGVIMAALLDLAVAAIPIGLPTAFRRFTPEDWHVGGAAYLAMAILVISLVWSDDRDLADRITRSRVVHAEGPDATIAPARGRALVLLDIVGVVGVLTVLGCYIAYYSPLLRFPQLL